MRRTGAFTLIELMVVVAMIGVLSVLSLVSMKEIGTRHQIRLDAFRLKELDSLVRDYASQGHSGVLHFSTRENMVWFEAENPVDSSPWFERRFRTDLREVRLIPGSRTREVRFSRVGISDSYVVHLGNDGTDGIELRFAGGSGYCQEAVQD